MNNNMSKIISVSIFEFALGNQEIDISFFIEILHPVFGHPGFQVQSTEFLSVFLRAHPCLIAHKFALTCVFCPECAILISHEMPCGLCDGWDLK